MKFTLKQKVMAGLASISLSGLALGTAIVFANTSSNTTSNIKPQASLSLEQAKEVAQKEAKAGQIIGYSQKVKNGKVTFEIDLLNGKNEIEYKIDGQTGNILKTKSEDLSKDKEEKQLIGAQPKIDLAKAESLIREKYPKLSLEELALGVEENTLVYEISGKDGNKEVELHLDATTGTFEEKDKEKNQKDHENDQKDDDSDQQDDEKEND